jgi:hypothetical protein
MDKPSVAATAREAWNLEDWQDVGLPAAPERHNLFHLRVGPRTVLPLNLFIHDRNVFFPRHFQVLLLILEEVLRDVLVRTATGDVSTFLGVDEDSLGDSSMQYFSGQGLLKFGYYFRVTRPRYSVMLPWLGAILARTPARGKCK